VCDAINRIQLQIDDSELKGPSIVYFDNQMNELVFVGGLAPDIGSYEIRVVASIRAQDTYLDSSFTFTLAVVGLLPSEIQDERETQCLSSKVNLRNFKTDYSFRFHLNQLSMQQLHWSDTLGGVCHEFWRFSLETPQIEGVIVQYSQGNLFFFSERPDLPFVTSKMVVFRGNGERLAEVTFNHTLTELEPTKQVLT
jgi:hypothetical protein